MWDGGGRQGVAGRKSKVREVKKEATSKTWRIGGDGKTPQYIVGRWQGGLSLKGVGCLATKEKKE